MDPEMRQYLEKVCEDIIKNLNYDDRGARIHSARIIHVFSSLSKEQKEKFIELLLEKQGIFTSEEAEYLSHLLPLQLAEHLKSKKAKGKRQNNEEETL